MRLSGSVLVTLILCGVSAGQVFTVNPNAGNGKSGEDDQAWYGDFGLDSANNPAYKIYRKNGPRGDGEQEGTVAENTPNNPSSMTWTQMYHNDDVGIIDPGMWIGTAPGTSSPANELLYFKAATDEEGGGVDDNFRRDWDVRFGFLEDPDAFVNSREPNDESWDMWSGEWSTDGVSAQMNLGTNELNEESDWYVRGNNFRLNAADSVFGNEGERDAVDWQEIVYAGSGEDVESFDGNNAFAGAGYDDALEISWNMELNDPDNADPERAREVKFTVKAGNILRTGLFDPGDENNPVAPNFGDEEPYSDGFFDWQNATPVFFVAPVGGGEASGSLGVYIPGDHNADGTVNDDDRAIILDNMGEADTSYARGDLNQDGVTDAADLAAWDSTGDPKVQLESITDPDERLAFVHDVLNTWMGDSNCDGEFNSGDLVEVFTAGEYQDGIIGNSTWATGDWDGNKDFDSSDFVVAFTDGGYELGPRVAAANAVPEPTGFALIWCGLLALARWRKK